MAKQTTLPPQHQDTKPGHEGEMIPRPVFDDPNYRAAGKLKDKAAIITGGDSGIGRAISVIYAKEGADVAVVYLNEQEDAEETAHIVEEKGRRCLLLQGDIRDEAFCREAVEKTLNAYGKLDILVNNAGEHWDNPGLEDLDMRQMERIFQTNIFSMFYICKAALPHLKEGSAIVNTASITAYRGSGHLVDYAASKGAIVAFTRSLSAQLVPRGIRVNGVAPGPIWTPLIPASFSAEDVRDFGKNTPMGRPGQPCEVAPCYVFLASSDSSYMSGQILHPNGGSPINT